MLIAFRCLNCGKEFQKDASLAGKKGRCSQCGHVFEIPGPPRMASAAAVAKGSGPGPRHPTASSSSLSSSASSSPSPRRESARAGTAAASPFAGGLDDDPYGLNDVPSAPKKVDSAPEDDLVMPRRSGTEFPGPKTTPKTRKPSRRDGGDFFEGLPGFVYLAAAAVLAAGFLFSLASPTIGAYVFLGGAVLSFLVFFLYGLAGLLIIPFRESFWTGFLCSTCLPYLLGYTLRRRDVMGGVVLSLVASFGVIILMALALPGMAALNRGRARAEGSLLRAAPPRIPDGMPPEFPARRLPTQGMPGPAFPSPPPGVQPPAVTNSINLNVTGLKNQASGKTFGDKLGELVKQVSGGFQISSSGSGGRNTYSISMVNTMSVQAFADQITWARVTRVSGQTIEIDASAMGRE